MHDHWDQGHWENSTIFKTKVTYRTAWSQGQRSPREQHRHWDQGHLENYMITETKVIKRTAWSLKQRSPSEQLDHWDQGHLDNSKITETKVTKRTVEASKGQEAVKLTTNVCSGVPWKASMSRMTEPLVEMRISLPSGLNFNPVQSHSLSCGNLNVANGPWKQVIVNEVIFPAGKVLLISSSCLVICAFLFYGSRVYQVLPADNCTQLLLFLHSATMSPPPLSPWLHLTVKTALWPSILITMFMRLVMFGKMHLKQHCPLFSGKSLTSVECWNQYFQTFACRSSMDLLETWVLI